MQRETRLNRRHFLAGIAATAGTAILAACGGGVDTSTPTPLSATSVPQAATGSGSITTAGGTTATGSSASGSAGAATAIPKPSGNFDFAPALKKGVTLRYQTFWTQFLIDTLKQSVADFTQRTGINVNIESFAGSADYRQNLATTMAAGTAADVFIADDYNMVKYFDAGLVLDLTDRVKADGIDLNKDYGLIGIEQYCGKTYMLPFDLSPHAWYYNKTMLKEVGAKDPWDDLNGQWTFDDFREIALKVTQTGGGKRWGAQLDPQIQYQWQPIIDTYGGAVTDFKANPPKYAIDQPKSIEAITMIVKWYRDDKIILPPDQSKAFTDQGITSPFASKLVGFMEKSSTQQTLYLTQNVKDFAWDIAPPLRKTKDVTPIGHADGDPTAVFAKTKYPDEAYAFAKHLAGPVTQEIFARTQLVMPALKAAGTSDAYLKAPPKHMRVFPDILHSYRTSFWHGNGLEVNTDFNNFAEELVLGTKQPSDATALTKAENAKISLGSCVPSYVGS